MHEWMDEPGELPIHHKSVSILYEWINEWMNEPAAPISLYCT